MHFRNIFLFPESYFFVPNYREGGGVGLGVELGGGGGGVGGGAGGGRIKCTRGKIIKIS